MSHANIFSTYTKKFNTIRFVCTEKRNSIEAKFDFFFVFYLVLFICKWNSRLFFILFGSFWGRENSATHSIKKNAKQSEQAKEREGKKADKIYTFSIGTLVQHMKRTKKIQHKSVVFNVLKHFIFQHQITMGYSMREALSIRRYDYMVVVVVVVCLWYVLKKNNLKRQSIQFYVGMARIQ